jgi:predicted  nucleic acid-binding Zn-ribbon protein
MEYLDKYGLFILGGLISLIAWFTNRLVKGLEDRVEKIEIKQSTEYERIKADFKDIDKQLDKITKSIVGIQVIQEMNTKIITDSVVRIESQLKEFSHRFETYDNNINEFWKQYGGKL